jgi:hypothetical protein
LHGQRKNTACIVKEECLLIRCLAMDVLLFRAFASAGMCLLSRYLAKSIHTTISIKSTLHI